VLGTSEATAGRGSCPRALWLSDEEELEVLQQAKDGQIGLSRVGWPWGDPGVMRECEQLELMESAGPACVSVFVRVDAYRLCRRCGTYSRPTRAERIALVLVEARFQAGAAEMLDR